MNCPSCTAGTLSPTTGVCELCGFSSRTAVAVDRPAVVVERARRELVHEFEFLEPVGLGDRSAVFAATERASGRRVILKAIARDGGGSEGDQLFRAAVSVHQQFDHPHLVPVLRCGVTDSLRWFTRDDVQATSLREVLRQGSRLEARAARRVATQLTSALEYLHRRGIVHGALRPENVLLDRHGWVHLCDPAVDLEMTGERPAWRAPEDFTRGERFPAADQYALAALLVEVLTGTTADEGDAAAALARADVPPHMTAAIRRALSVEPRDRFPSLPDFVWALESGAPSMADTRPAGRSSTSVMFISDWEPAPVPGRARRVVVGVAAAAGIALAIWAATPVLRGILRPAPATTVVIPATPAPTPAAEQPPPAAAAEPRPPRREAAAPRPAPPAEPGRLFVNATPWGQVFLDGRSVGNTPRANMEVAAGSHLLRVVREGFLPYERRITVRSGETLRLTDIVLTPRAP